MRLAVVAVFAALAAAPALAEEPSVKAGAQEVGRAIKNDVEEGYDKTKDATVSGYEKAKDATVNGVGTALDKTGSGIGTAGEKLQDAGESVKDKAK